MRILVTGSAGFIGSSLSKVLLEQGHEVVGVDNVNAYYDPALKEARLARLRRFKNFREERFCLESREKVLALFSSFAPERVAHLAAQAGVRYSIDHPEDYVTSNLDAFAHVLEGAARSKVRHFLFASSSSVYGAAPKLPLLSPFSETQAAVHPVSFYAATKRAGELMAHAYASVHGLPATGIRYFTVYGPWGRPDMALFRFTRAILAGETLEVYHEGRALRDFTYIDDAVAGTLMLLFSDPQGLPSGAAQDPSMSSAPFRLYNLGAGQPVEVLRLITLLEDALGRRAKLNLLPAHPGDVPVTWADTSALAQAHGFLPRVPLEEGVKRFVAWYLEHWHL